MARVKKTMKLDIQAEDRLGMALEILRVLVQNQCNIQALEVIPCPAFVSCDAQPGRWPQLQQQMLALPGVQAVRQIDLLPSERRRQHLDMLLSRLPDPIIDLDSDGDILHLNAAAADAFGATREQLEQMPVSRVIGNAGMGLDLAALLRQDGATVEVLPEGGTYLLDIQPVISHGQLNGAVMVLRSPQRIGQQLSSVKATHGEGIDTIIGISPAMLALQRQTLKFAALDLPVMILGETGTGKELLARALHEAGPRTSAPFLAINCATLAENLLESELFGYAAGAFSGAQRGGKPGLFELADKGTIFLDEIGEMSPYLQAKLLRFLQDLRFRRIGGTSELKVDVRILCATHRDLEAMADSGEFRADLFYRLNVLNLHLPPLRQRREDIPLLADYFLRRAAEQLNCTKPTLSREALRQLCEAPWPGNIRQLQNVIFRSAALLEQQDQPASQVEIDIAQLAMGGLEGRRLTHGDEPPADSEVYTAMAALPDVVSKGGAGAEHELEDVQGLDQALEAYEARLLANLWPLYPSTRRLAQRLQTSHAKIARKLKRYDIR